MLHSSVTTYSAEQSDINKTDLPLEQCTNRDVIPVFLHGFLGSIRDWQPCLPFVSSQHSILIDLPCHGQSKYHEVDDFDGACQQILLTIQATLAKHKLDPNSRLVLVGYSLGARLAMYGLAHGVFSDLNIQGAVFEGGNFGFKDESERKRRWSRDKQWSKRFATEGIEDVLFDWYEQGVFSSLTNAKRQALVDERCDNLGSQLARMLRATSLAKQPYLLDKLRETGLPFAYICAKKDDKFRNLAEDSGLNCYCVNQAGHNVHYEQPEAFSDIINQLIQSL